MKRMVFLLLMGISASGLRAQEIVIDKYEDNGQKGFSVLIQNKKEKVEDFLSSYFKANGKVKSRAGVFTITGLSRADFPYSDITVFSKVDNSNNNALAKVWLDESLMSEEHYSERLKELWYNFTIDFYRSLVQERIDESNQALQFAQKQFQRLEKDSINLKNDVVSNRAEKIKLEEALKTNELNYNTLLQKLTENAYTRDSVIVAIDKIKKLVELQEKEKNAIQ